MSTIISQLITGQNHLFLCGGFRRVTILLNIELYSDIKDWDNEKKVEDILEKYGIAYQKTESYLESEKMYEVLYEMEV